MLVDSFRVSDHNDHQIYSVQMNPTGERIAVVCGNRVVLFQLHQENLKIQLRPILVMVNETVTN